MRPTLSFVVPTRNQAQFLRECVDSCLAQGIDGAEVWVIDGASTDGTPQILAGYGDRIRWRSEPDRGQSDAINKGIRLATGEVIAWINSDDLYAAPDVLARVLDVFAAEPACDVVHGDGMLVDVRGAPFRRYASRAVDAAALYAHPTSLVQPSVFFRRQLFLDVGGLREDLHWAMDFDLWLRLFEAARQTRYLPEVFTHVRSHADAKTQRGMLRQIGEVRRLKRAWARGRRLDPRTRLAGLASTVLLYAYWAAVRTGLVRAT